MDYVGIEKETNTKFYLSSHIGDNYISDIFTDEVEIIEEPKKIEKMKCSVAGWFSQSQADTEIIKKINELIDEIKNLKENN